MVGPAIYQTTVICGRDDDTTRKGLAEWTSELVWMTRQCMLTETYKLERSLQLSRPQRVLDFSTSTNSQEVMGSYIEGRHKSTSSRNLCQGRFSKYWYHTRLFSLIQAKVLPAADTRQQTAPHSSLKFVRREQVLSRMPRCAVHVAQFLSITLNLPANLPWSLLGFSNTSKTSMCLVVGERLFLLTEEAGLGHRARAATCSILF